jgi:NAD(P)-dependent dehydrogenase (short-subunit alcohol dehydrogenase family)
MIIGDLKLTPEAQHFVTSVGPDRIIFQPCDVTKWDQLQQLVSASEEKYGDVPDVWIAGAGVFEPVRLLIEFSFHILTPSSNTIINHDLKPLSNFWLDTEGARYTSVDINISHPMKLTRIAMRAVLGKNKPGTVLIISSISGIRGNYGAPMYCATKFAIVGFVRGLAEAEKREGVRVMAICLGLTHTHLWSDRPDTMNDFFYAPEHAMCSTDVAERIIEMCQQKIKYGGGIVLETSLYGTRMIPEWNVDPPKHPPLGVGTADKAGQTYGHVKSMLKNEHGAALENLSSSCGRGDSTFKNSRL